MSDAHGGCYWFVLDGMGDAEFLAVLRVCMADFSLSVRDLPWSSSLSQCLYDE